MQNRNHIEITVPMITEAFDQFEIHPVRLSFEEAGKKYFEQCTPDEADFWSVYIHRTAGGLECIADAQTKDDAEQLLKLLLGVIRFSRMDTKDEVPENLFEQIIEWYGEDKRAIEEQTISDRVFSVKDKTGRGGDCVLTEQDIRERWPVQSYVDVNTPDGEEDDAELLADWLSNSDIGDEFETNDEIITRTTKG